MKAKRRHELHENVLAGELGKVVEFLKKRGSHLATGALVIALAIFAYFVYSGRSEAARSELQRHWDHAMTGQVEQGERARILMELAEQTDNARIASLASVELGFDSASRALFAEAGSERAALDDAAAEWYRKTIEKFPSQAEAVAKAHYGLGKLYESKRELQKAIEEYRQVRASAEVAGHPVTVLARLSLDKISTLDSPVRMATTMPATQPTTQPATQPTTATASPPTTQPATAPKP